MLRLSAAFIAALLIGTSSASPAVSRSLCSPSAIDTSVNYFIQSSADSKVWQVEDVSNDDFIFVDLQAKTSGSSDQLWSVVPITGDTFSFVSAGVSAASVCANGDGGPLDSSACPNVGSKQVAATAEWIVTCQACASNGATGCQLQASAEGQCANFQDDTDTTVKLDDCSSAQSNESWDFVASA
ncbi:hypothetical protein BJ165DRAFT_1529090 [Panaeolus papilionaceus]|nr:hypothetical protein BJ165DRAFT_1529090 [Panaeolus papilionaceus]